MFRTIVVPLDGSLLAEHALPLAAGIAKRSGGTLRLARVHTPYPGAADGDWVPDAAVARQEQAYLDATAKQLHHLTGQKACTTLIEEGSVARALAAHAAALGADLMVLTTHGRGPLSRFWLGSVTDELLRTAQVPLLVYRPADEAPPPAPDADRRFRRILVPLDGSEVGEVAVAPAAELAKLMGGELTLLRVIEALPVVTPDGLAYSPPAFDPVLMEELAAQARQYLDHTAARLRHTGLTVHTRVATGVPAPTAILEASADADLIALATHGRSRVARLFLGSVADKVVRGAACPVLVARTRPAPD